MINKKPLKPMKKVYILVHEGDADGNLFSYLKVTLKCNKKFTPENLNGCSDLTSFKDKYNKIKTRYGLRSNSKLYELIFLFDNDLDENKSFEIRKYIQAKGHAIIQTHPNIEGFLLELIGKKISFKVKTELDRKNCKKLFFKEFSLEAHQLKTKDWEKIFGQSGFKIEDLAANNPILKSLTDLIVL